MARSAGVRVILDPAPAPNDWPAELLHVDLLTPNESEAAALVGSPVENIEQAEAAARALREKGAQSVAITLGDRGTLLLHGEQALLVEPFAVQAVDTTAAGDAFAGALAVYWAEGNNLPEAVRLANAAGALAASRQGAQPGMPSREEIEDLGRTPR
jgi:ribokinase